MLKKFCLDVSFFIDMLNIVYNCFLKFWYIRICFVLILVCGGFLLLDFGNFYMEGIEY